MAATEAAATARPTTTFFNANSEYVRTITISFLSVLGGDNQNQQNEREKEGGDTEKGDEWVGDLVMTWRSES